MLPNGTTSKIKDFRTYLEIQSSVLACKQTDTDFVYYNQCKAYLQARLQGSRSRLLRERFAESKASANHRLVKGGSQRSIIYVLLIFEIAKINRVALRHHSKIKDFRTYLEIYMSRSRRDITRHCRAWYVQLRCTWYRKPLAFVICYLR